MLPQYSLGRALRVKRDVYNRIYVLRATRDAINGLTWAVYMVQGQGDRRHEMRLSMSTRFEPAMEFFVLVGSY